MSKVSIIMPALNAEKYIAKSIESVRKQSFNDWELLITDDNSTDGTTNIIRDYRTMDNRIKLYMNADGSGPASARNNSIQYASGQWIAFLDADDIWHCDKLFNQIVFMKKQNIDFTFTSYNYIDTAGAFLKKIEVPVAVCHSDLMKRNMIATATVMIRRVAFQDLSMPDFPRAQDFALWLKLLRQVDQAHGLQEVLSDYRITPNTGNRRKIFTLKYLYDIYTQQEGKSPLDATILIFRMYLHRIAKHETIL